MRHPTREERSIQYLKAHAGVDRVPLMHATRTDSIGRSLLGVALPYSDGTVEVYHTNLFMPDPDAPFDKYLTVEEAVADGWLID
jgi:hypothetical protein